MSLQASRGQKVLDLYAEGLDFREIGARLGISHEQARQDFFRAGGQKSSIGDRRYASAVEGREREIVASFLRFRDDLAVAAELGLSAQHVRRCVDEHVPEPEVLRRHSRRVSPRHTEDELVACLLAAARECESPMTKEAYDAWATVRAEQQSVPGAQAIMLRFRGWRAALTRAGLPANPSAGPDATYDLADGLNAIATCWRDLGSSPSVQQYDAWRRDHAGFPASATVRRLVQSWNELQQGAYELVYGLSPVATQEMATPERSVALGSEVGTAYVRANEASSVAVGQPFDLDPQLLERALEGHARLQNALADLAARLGMSVLSPNAGDPPFDVAWLRGDGGLTVVEVKSATPSNLEGQMRLGLGQVMRYAQLLRDMGLRVAPALVVELEPDECWLRLCESVGVPVAWPGALGRVLSADDSATPDCGSGAVGD